VASYQCSAFCDAQEYPRSDQAREGRHEGRKQSDYAKSDNEDREPCGAIFFEDEVGRDVCGGVLVG
jgi:hypothetical protein